MKDSELADLFLALAGEPRVKVLRLLADKAMRCTDPAGCDLSERCCTISDLAKGLNLTLATTSHHLKELRRSGLVTAQRRGKFVHCAVNPETMQRLARMFTALAQTNPSLEAEQDE